MRVARTISMAHGRRTVMDNGSATQKQRTSRGSRKGAALSLKFFNVKTSERFVFKRRDKRCLTLPPRSNLIPVFIHFSDFFPDLVQTTLSKCKALILGCERVVILKPNQVWSVLFSPLCKWQGSIRTNLLHFLCSDESNKVAKYVLFYSFHSI